MTSKLEDSNTAPKTYWLKLNPFLSNKKIPAIPPLLVDGKFILDFCEKANLSNNFFGSICIAITNNSRLSPYVYKKTLEFIAFVLLNSSKAHGYDNTSVKMIKTCNESLTISLKIIFEEPLK